jgi:transcriptional regulator with XRE-family HTH domain
VRTPTTTQLTDVGRRVSELRAGTGWTQEQFAERAARSVQWLRRIEAGANITLATFFELARLLGARPADLFTRPRSRVVRQGRPPRAVRAPSR